MRRDAGAEQLVRAEGEHVQHRRVDLAQRPVHAGGDDRVVRPLPAQRPVDQLGGQRRVPAVELAALAPVALRSSGGSTRLAYASRSSTARSASKARIRTGSFCGRR